MLQHKTAVENRPETCYIGFQIESLTSHFVNKNNIILKNIINKAKNIIKLHSYEGLDVCLPCASSFQRII